MFLTRKQAEKVARQARNDMEKVVKILRDMDFTVLDGVGHGKRGTGMVMVPNSDGTVTRFHRDKKYGLTVSIDKMDWSMFE